MQQQQQVLLSITAAANDTCAIQQAEIDFCGDTLVKRYLERSGRSILHDKIRAATAAGDSNALDLVLREYGTEVNALSQEPVL